jgi:hypothetical protein
VDERDGRRRERRIAEARFPRIKRLDDFDLSAAPTIPPATLAALAALAALASLAWVAAGEPVALLGDPGTGKRSRGTPTSTAVCLERAVLRVDLYLPGYASDTQRGNHTRRWRSNATILKT